MLQFRVRVTVKFKYAVSQLEQMNEHIFRTKLGKGVQIGQRCTDSTNSSEETRIAQTPPVSTILDSKLAFGRYQHSTTMVGCLW